MRNTIIASLLAAAALSISACSAATENVAASTTQVAYDTAGANEITLSGSENVTISSAGTYRLSGTLEAGVVVNAPEDAKVVLILDGVNINNPNGPAIEVQQADDVIIELNGTNTLSDSASYPEGAEANAALYSTADLTLTGEGTLNVEGRGEDGIVTKDDLLIESGTYNISAADDGIRGTDSVSISGGTFHITATTGDAIRSTKDDDPEKGWVTISGGTITASAGDDGIDAVTGINLLGGEQNIGAVDKGLNSNSALLIDGATLTITNSEEGLQGGHITITSGDVNITASDDGINASADTGEITLEITGGTIVIDAEGDGLDSNGTTTISGGTTIIYGPSAMGNGALDSEGSTTISGGELLAIGAAGMAQAPVASGEQSFIQANLSGSAGQTLHITDADGTEIASFTVPKGFGNVIYSNGDIAQGAAYTVSVSGSGSGSGAGFGSGSGSGAGLGSAGTTMTVTAGESTDAGRNPQPNLRFFR